MKTHAPQSVFSLCNLPPWVLADVAFQEEPQPLAIGQIRELNRRLFRMLEEEPEPSRRGEIFHEYLSVQFALHQWQEHQNRARSCLRNSYVRYLRGWAVDSNSMEGAVLKGWVHSRTGLPPTFHHTRLEPFSEAFNDYALERIRGCARTNAIESQLDLLFAFCQEELLRRHPGERWITLYRGTYDASDYPNHQDGGGSRESIVKMNNLSSFTLDRECAWEFGSTVWEVRVPLAKVFFFSDLLPESILRGEDEYLVIGGDYRVRKLVC